MDRDISEWADELREKFAGERNQLQHAGKPLFVEFSGTPKSGKSTCIDIIAHFFKRRDFRVLAPPEGASKRTPYYLKQNWPAFNTWSACYALTHVLEGQYHSDQYDLAILDRGLFDALAWFEFLCDRGEIGESEKKTIHEFLLLERWRSQIDLVLLFTTDPATALDRENAQTLTDDPGSAMNLGVLEGLNKAYVKVKKQHAERFPQFIDIDTRDELGTTPKATADLVVRGILRVMEGRS